MSLLFQHIWAKYEYFFIAESRKYIKNVSMFPIRSNDSVYTLDDHLPIIVLSFE